MKQCSRCLEDKEKIEYRKNTAAKDGLEAACKSCRRAYDTNTYSKNPVRRKAIRESNDARHLVLAKMIREYLNSNPCIDCGLDDPELLEFDHVRGQKTAGVGNLVARVVSWKMIEEEIDKCEVRCLHCHRKRTIKQFGWYASLVQ